MMSGRLAEMIFFNHQSTGASNDIERATELARKMVTEWGFDENIGPVCYAEHEGEVFLGRDISKHKVLSETMAEAIDDAVSSLSKRCNEKARQLMEQNRQKLVDLAEALFEEIDRIMAGEKLTSSKKSRQYKALEELKKKREEEETPPPDPGLVPENA